MVLVILVCVGLAIYCFINGMIGIGLLALGGLLRSFGFISLALAAVFLVIQQQYIAALFPPFIIAWNLWGVHILKKQQLGVKEEVKRKIDDGVAANQITADRVETNNMNRLGESIPKHKNKLETQPIRVSGGGSNLVENLWKNERRTVKARRVEIMALIEAIESDEDGLSVKDKAKVIELAGGAISWNNKNDSIKGCTVMFNRVERVFHDMNSLDKWIRGVVIPRIHDYLQM